MLHARDDYNRRVQDIDLDGLVTLVREMILGYLDELDTEEHLEQAALWEERFQKIMAGIIPADEPVFLIRAQDQVGAAAVRAWANLHRLNGGSDIAYSKAMEHADRMECWPVHKAADI